MKLFKRKPKHVHSGGPVNETYQVMTLGNGPMTYATRQCTECGVWYTRKYKGLRTPESFDA